MKHFFPSLFLTLIYLQSLGQLAEYNFLQNQNQNSPLFYLNELSIIEDYKAHKNYKDIIGDRTDVWQNNVWIGQDSTEYIYSNNVEEELTRKFIDGNWEFTEKKITNSDATYKPDLNIMEPVIVNQEWNGFNWINVNRSFVEYNDQNQIAKFLFQDWEGGAWINSSQHLYDIDSSGEIPFVIWEKWENDKWINWNMIAYTYDANDNIKTLLWKQWENEMWENYLHSTYTYEGETRVNWLFEIWAETDWEKTFYHTYQYDSNNNRVLDLRERWENVSWENYDKDITEYDMDNNAILNLSQVWDTNEWVNELKIINEYDENDKILELRQGWNNAEWTNEKRTLFYYIDLPTILGYFSTSETLLKIYPNPSNGFFKIDFRKLHSKICTINIYDLTGRIVYSKPLLNKSNNINLSFLKNNQYIVKVQYDHNLYTHLITIY